MNNNLFQQVRTSCRTVAEQAASVFINHNRISSYAEWLPLDEDVRFSPDPSYHYLGHGDDTVAFFLTLNAINFGSGYFPCMLKRNSMSGYFTVASCLNDHFMEKGPFTARQLAEITTDDCICIFHQKIAPNLPGS